MAKVNKTAGIHHISAIVGHPQENIDFYAGVLGLRLIKKTINFDDPGTYHLYFGNEGGKPGTIITFFPWAGAEQGRIGDGQVGVTSYAIPSGSMDFWKKRLEKFNIPYTEKERFDETYLAFDDIHGLKLELVEKADGQQNTWTFGDVTPDVAIKGFDGAILYSANPEETVKVLQETMGLDKLDENEEFIRLKSYGDIGNKIDVKKTKGTRGVIGVGTVHHIAWRAEDDADHVKWQEKIRKSGFMTTPIKNRNYFNAVYFREHGKILFEIATDPPGFAIDEEADKLGESLKLPSQYEQYRDDLNQTLIPIEVKDLDQ